ncbi:MAG: response regulator transcription factor [Chitinophagaceae bacterium]|nr:response regulator transcription factor [Chitinophagaceae bacterium]
MEKITILIADDHTLVRQSWSYILNADLRFKVIGECASGEEAVELAKETRPNVVIMDINMPGMNGIEATQQIRKYSPGSRILGVSLHTQPAYVRQMIHNGAMGYVTKNSSCEELLKAIMEIASHRKYICEEIKTILSDNMISNDEQHQGLNSLSRREIEIIGFIRKGYSSKEIAEMLNLSVKTVEVHRYNTLKKLNLKNSAAMVNYINNSQLGIAS